VGEMFIELRIIKPRSYFTALAAGVDPDVKQTDDEKRKLLRKINKSWKNLLYCGKVLWRNKYINHWYNDDYAYVLTEYYSGGDLSVELTKGLKDKNKFTEEVGLFFLFFYSYIPQLINTLPY
jgi:hypothetical protein